MARKPIVNGKKLTGFTDDDSNGELFLVHSRITKGNNSSSAMVRNHKADEKVFQNFGNEGKVVKGVQKEQNDINHSEKNDFSSEDEKEIDEEYFAPPQPQNYFISSELQNVLKELISSEETYVEKLRSVVEQYTSFEPDGENSNLFENMESLYAECLNFLRELKQNMGNIHRILHTFINAESTLFNLYISYLESSSKFDESFEKCITTVEARNSEFESSFDLRTYLSSPFHRLSAYTLFLERLRKLMIKSSDSYDDSVNVAINIIKRTMEHSNEKCNLHYIKFWNANEKTSGSFIMKEDFFLLKPDTYNATVFLFENDVVFTRTLSEKIGKFKYVDHIEVSNLALTEMEHEEVIFHLIDYSGTRKTPKGDKIHTYILQAENKDVKKKWIQKIKAMLWKEFENAKAKGFSIPDKSNEI